MDIFPVWRTTYYDTVEDSITFRITNDDGEEIYRARADRRPDEDIMRINLNKPCQNALDSMLPGWNGESDVVVPQNAYMVFHLQFPDGDGWETVYSFAFTNDWSYEDHQGNEYSEPINGHAAPGQILTYSYLVTGDSETICEFSDTPSLTIISGRTVEIGTEGGDWNIKYITHKLDIAYYEVTAPDGEIISGWTSGGTLNIEIPESEDYYDSVYEIIFYIEPGGTELDRGTATIDGFYETYATQYLTMRALGNGAIKWIKKQLPLGQEDTGETIAIQYSKDSGNTWTTVSSSIAGDTINVTEGDVIWYRSISKYAQRFYGTHKGYTTWTAYHHFESTCEVDVYGNIMSLIYRNDFYGENTIGHSGAFAGLFYGCDVISARHLILPTILNEGCYSDLFLECASLTKAPALPATTLANECYTGMFKGCASLTKAPALPATTLANECYMSMFEDCYSLTKAPELPATEMKYWCYNGMFYMSRRTDGTGNIIYPLLTKAPALPATTLANACYRFMFAGMCPDFIPPALPATTLAESCYDMMFLQSHMRIAPEVIPATTLAKECCHMMFAGCENITKAPELPATTLAEGCYGAMFQSCRKLKNSPILNAEILAKGCYEEMFEGCEGLTRLTCLATDILAENSTANWLRNSASPFEKTFVKAAEMNSWPRNSYSGIPNGWTVVNYN